MPWREPLVHRVFTRFRGVLLNDRLISEYLDYEDETFYQVKNELEQWRYSALSPVMFTRAMVKAVEESLGDQSRLPSPECMARYLDLQHLCSSGVQLIHQAMSGWANPVERDCYILKFIDHMYLCPGSHCLRAVNWARFIELLQLVYENIPGFHRATEQTELPLTVIQSLNHTDYEWFVDFLESLRRLENGNREEN